MADDAGDKTEAPTPRRLTDAREEGRVARSTDLNAAIGLLAGLMLLHGFGSRVTAAWLTLLRDGLSARDPAAVSRIDLLTIVSRIGTTVLFAIGPILAGLLLASLLSNLLQIGLLLTPRPLAPKFSKLNPISGVKRLFSAQTWVQLGMNLVKLAVVGFVAYRAIRDRAGDILVAIATGGWKQVAVMSSLLYDVGLKLALILLVLALLDFAWQKYRFIRDMRMSKQEVKEEMRRMEGDPVMKQRRRQAQLAAALQRIKSAVPKADVVVTNPTELAIAIRYDPDTMAAPRVVAKGKGHLAKKIREIAIAHRIPIVERKPLAQALYKTVEVGQEVPEQFYKAIAEILAYVYELTGRTPGRRAASAA